MIDYYAGPRRIQIARHPLREFLSDAASLLGGVIVVGAVGFGFAAMIGPTVGGASPLVTILILVSLALMVRNMRRARAMVVVQYLEQAIRLNLPIPAMLIAAEHAERGGLRRCLMRLRQLIEDGGSVGDSLALAVPGVPPRVSGLIRGAERIGRLPESLGRVVRRSDTATDREPAQTIMLRWYPIAMLLCISPMFGMVIIFVLPKLQHIFREFHLELPLATVWMLQVWNFMAIPLAVLAAIVLLAFCGRTFSEFLPRRGNRVSPIGAITDRLAWFLPPLRAVVRSRGLADTCYLLSNATAAGQPMDRSLFEAADACANRVLRGRIRRWSEQVTSGTPIADAARQEKMPALMVGLLSTARGPTGTKEVFDFLARYYDSRFSAAAALLRGAAIPVMVGIMAVFVATLALGLFVPFVELMNHLGSGRGAM